MTKRITKRKVRKPAPTIEVDGVTYRIPSILRDCADEEIRRVIRGWKPEPDRTADLLPPIKWR